MTTGDHLIDTDTVVRLLRRSCTSIGIELPTAVTDGLAQAEKLSTAVSELFPTFDRDTLASAVITALDAHRDPLQDKTVQDLLNRRHLAEAGLGTYLTKETSRRRAQAITTAVPEVFNALSEVVDRADDSLHRALAEFGTDFRLDDNGSVSQMTPAQATLWVEARNAAMHVMESHQVWRLLSQHVHRMHIDGSWTSPLVVADLDLETLDVVAANVLGTAGRDPLALRIVRTGNHLSFADFDTFRERQQRAEHARAERAEQVRVERARAGAAL